jgi:hypothetical protein
MAKPNKHRDCALHTTPSVHGSLEAWTRVYVALTH